VYERQVELTIGDVLQVGELRLKILDIDGDEIHVQVDEGDEWSGVELPARELALAYPR
jgi:hypothetical protein